RLALDPEALAPAGNARVEELGDRPDVAFNRAAEIGEPFVVRRLGVEFDRTGSQAGIRSRRTFRRRAATRGYWRVKTPTPSIVVDGFAPLVVWPTPSLSPLGPNRPPPMRAAQLGPLQKLPRDWAAPTTASKAWFASRRTLLAPGLAAPPSVAIRKLPS